MAKKKSKGTNLLITSIFLFILSGLTTAGILSVQETAIIDFPSKSPVIDTFGHSNSCLRNEWNFPADFMGYSITIQEIPQIGEKLSVNNQVYSISFSDSYIDANYLCESNERESSLRISNKKYQNIVDPTVKITEKSTEFWEGSNNNDLTVSFNSPISFSKVVLFYKFYLPQTVAGDRPTIEFKRDIQITNGLNEFTINIPQNFVTGEYAVDIRFYTIQISTKFLEQISEEVKIDIIEPVRKLFIIVPPRPYLVVALDENCPDTYLFEINTENTKICKHKNYEKLACNVLGVPIVEDYNYVCGSNGLPVEVLWQPFNCESNLDCQSIGLDKCQESTGVCYEEVAFEVLVEVQCTENSQLHIPCRGVIASCIDNKIVYDGECLIEESPQSVSLIDFKAINIVSSPFNLEFPRLITKGIITSSLPLSTMDNLEETESINVELIINKEFKANLRYDKKEDSFKASQELNFRNNFFEKSGNTISLTRDGEEIGFNLRLFEKHLCLKNEDVYCPVSKSAGKCVDFTPICEVTSGYVIENNKCVSNNENPKFFSLESCQNNLDKSKIREGFNKLLFIPIGLGSFGLISLIIYFVRRK